jgi:hypothetical protein|tara:strand:+ start:7 stop:210 length:204 start_codon:yes stop_codon:yes gene_type:complete
MKKEKDSWNFCCCGGRKGFPTFPVIILALGVWWLLSDLGIITVDVPWIPIILITIAIGWIVDSVRKR